MATDPKLRTGLRNADFAVNAIFSNDFQTFGEPSLEHALTESKRFCLAMASNRQPAYWLTLFGPSGTGKTMLAKRIARFFSRNLDGFLDERFNATKERVLRKGGMKPWVDAVTEMLGGDYSGIRNLRADWFVCIDDIGAEYVRNKELSSSKLYEVLNAREGRFTVLTANLSLQQVAESLDVRIASRLLRHGNTVVDVSAPDFNLR